ncbi:ABC transporter ATP-binding protein [Nitrospira sp. Nam74]
MATISLSHIVKRYGQTEVLHDVSLDVGESELMVFVGPSGCGKSTLLRTIAGFERPTAGDVAIDGRVVNDRPPNQRGVAMVFQNYALYPHMTAGDNIGFALRNLRVPESDVRRRVAAIAEMLQIQSLLQRRPHEMSGGQRQRVAIGRALIRDPKVFLFDEPLSNLDAALRVQMRVELARLHQRLSASMVYVTHDQTEAMTLADRMTILNAGRIEQIGRPVEVYRHPINLFVAGFLGAPPMNLLPGVVHAARNHEVHVRLGHGFIVHVDADATALTPGAPVTVGVRPEQLRIGAPGDGMVGVVSVAERLGHRTLLYVALRHAASVSDGSMPDIIVEAGAAESVDESTIPKPGDHIHVSAPPQALHLFDSRGRAVPALGERTASVPEAMGQ